MLHVKPTPKHLRHHPWDDEKHAQAKIKQLLRLAGGVVFDTSQPFRALITPGVPDLIAFVPRRGLVFIECKGPLGKQSKAQRGFQAQCEAAGVPYLLADRVEIVADWLNRAAA